MELNFEIRIEIFLFNCFVRSSVLSCSPTVFEQVLYFRTLVALYPSVLLWLVKPGNSTAHAGFPRTTHSDFPVLAVSYV